MAINALNCGANVWLADLEDANTPHWRNVVGGQVVLRDAVRRTLAFTAPDGKEYRLREDGDLPTIVPRPRGWHLPERHLLVDGEPDGGRPGRRRALPLPQRPGAAGPRQRPVLLPAEDGGPPRGGALGAGVRPRRAGARPPGRLDPRHHADRDHPGRVRDGGDAARAGQPRHRPQRRPLGLPVQRDQGLPRRRAAVRAARPRRGDDDRADDARLHRPARLRLPPPRRARDRRDGRGDPEPARRRGQRPRAGQGHRRQDPRGRRRLRRLLGRAPGSGRHLPRGLRRRPRRPAQPARPPRDDVA